jgi:hypothetical protein
MEDIAGMMEALPRMTDAIVKMMEDFPQMEDALP